MDQKKIQEQKIILIESIICGLSNEKEEKEYKINNNNNKKKK